jgi:hypothetical protein
MELKDSTKISRMKNAIVEWGMPETLNEFYLKVAGYSRGDVKSGIWNFPGKGLMSHNIKVLSIFARYVILLGLLILSIINPFFFTSWIFCLFAYLAWAFRKIYLEFGDYKISLWGPVLQITSDIGVMFGFISGILNR